MPPAYLQLEKGKGWVFAFHRKETPAYSGITASSRGSEMELDSPSLTEVQTNLCADSQPHTENISWQIWTHTDYTQIAQAIVVTHSQLHSVLVLQASSPTTLDPTQRTQSDTGIRSHQATVDLLTSQPTDSQPHPREPPSKSHTDSQPQSTQTNLISCSQQYTQAQCLPHTLLDSEGPRGQSPNSCFIMIILHISTHIWTCDHMWPHPALVTERGTHSKHDYTDS